MDIPDQTLSGSDLTITVDEQIGSGAHWQTFRARTQGGDPIAVRTLQGTIPPGAYDRFESLAAQWHTVSNEETVRTLLDWGTDPEPWVAVDYTPRELESYATGTSIEAAVECDLATRAELLRNVCDAIRSYGRYGSTRAHLAVGPESVSFREGPDGPTAVVDDWGISRLVDDSPVTPYTAPEQVAVDDRDGDDGGHAGQATDVYRIGALGVHLFSGSPPFPNDGSSLSDRIRRGIDEEAGFPDVADEFVPALRRATARDPADRHEGVYQLGRDISAAAPRVPPGERSVAALLSPEEDDPVGTTDSDDGDDGDDGDSANPADSGSNEVEANAEPTDEDEDADGLNGGPTDDGDDDLDPDSGATGANRESSGSALSKAIVAIAFALIVLVAGVYGAMMFGLIGGEEPTDGVELATVNGTVFATGDEPVEGMTVTLDPLGDPEELERQEVTTEADGTFTVENVSAGNYSVLFDDTNAFEYDDRELEITESGTDDLEIHPDRALVSGEVVDAETGEPISTDGDVEVDASIELVDTSGERESVVDAASGGDYEFTVTEFDGNYTVNADADGYESDSLDIQAFGEQDAIELDPVTMSLSGQVSGSREGEEGIEGATVTVMTAVGQEFTATTDADGNYETNEAIPIGDHDVAVEADGYVTAAETIEFEEIDVEQHFELDAESSIFGTATTENDVPQRFEIELRQDGELVWEGNSDSNAGEYSIEGLAPGTYELIAERADVADRAQILIEPGEQIEANIEINSETLSVEITVVD